jgi:hypothetical protein
LITVAGIWCVAIGVMRIVLSFEVKHLPDDVDKAWGVTDNGRTTHADGAKSTPAAA